MIGRAVRTLERLTLGPLLVRSGLFLSAAAALLLAAPPSGRSAPAILAGLVLAAAPAFAPGGPLPAVVILAAAATWGLATEAFGQPVTLARVLLLATLLYLVHSLSALAAALPSDAVVAPEVGYRWLARALGVVLAAAVLSTATLAGLAGLAGQAGGRHVAASLAGLALAVALAALLARSARPPAGDGPGVIPGTVRRTGAHARGRRGTMEA
jgi:hypothetical protein